MFISYYTFSVLIQAFENMISFQHFIEDCAKCPTLLLLSLLAILLVGTLHQTISRNADLPPGPLGFPFIGIAPFLAIGKMDVTLKRWAAKYGRMMSAKIGRDTVIIVNRIDLVKEAFSKDVFSGRPQNFFSKDIIGERGRYTFKSIYPQLYVILHI